MFLKFFANFSQSAAAPVRTDCFATQQMAKTLRNEINTKHTIFTWKNLSPFKVKNHDLPHVEFSHNPLTGKNCYKITPTVTK